MIQPLIKFRKHRRRAAMVLLFVWIWCLATATLAQTMDMAMEVTSPWGSASHAEQAPGPGAVPVTVDHSVSHSLSDSGHRPAGHAGHAPHQAAATPECCPEDSDVVPLQPQLASIAPAALLVLFVLLLLSLRPAPAAFLARRLIPLPSIRRHALHCTYLN